MTKRYDPPPVFVDLIPVGPIRSTPFAATTPLVHVATDAELRETTVRDPIVGDTITCADLIIRDRACWQDADAKYPPRDAYTLSAAEREQMRTAHGTCAVRRAVLLRVCRVGSVRAG